MVIIMMMIIVIIVVVHASIIRTVITISIIGLCDTTCVFSHFMESMVTMIGHRLW